MLFFPLIQGGGLRISDIQYDFIQNADEEYDQGKLPNWFVDNNWHHLIYVAYSSGDAPGAAAACTAGVDCLQLSLEDNSTANTIQSLVIAAGEEINNLAVPLTQNRANGNLSDYFENANLLVDDAFASEAYQAGFNDQVMVLRPAAIQ